jgi:hypothetical protein
MKTEEKKRKVRSDKKRDVKPTISVNLKECVNRLSYITNTPVKDVAESICEAGLNSKKVIEYLSQYFRRDFRVGNTFYLGDLNRISLQKKKFNVPSSRITIRFTQSTYEKINALSYALDVTPTRATGILLDASIRNTNFINTFAKNYIKGQLDQGRMKELKKVLKFINENNPYEEDISWATLLSYIFDEIKEGTITVKTALVNWIDKYK